MNMRKFEGEKREENIAIAHAQEGKKHEKEEGEAEEEEGGEEEEEEEKWRKTHRNEACMARQVERETEIGRNRECEEPTNNLKKQSRNSPTMRTFVQSYLILSGLSRFFFLCVWCGFPIIPPFFFPHQ